MLTPSGSFFLLLFKILNIIWFPPRFFRYRKDRGGGGIQQQQEKQQQNNNINSINIKKKNNSNNTKSNRKKRTTATKRTTLSTKRTATSTTRRVESTSTATGATVTANLWQRCGRAGRVVVVVSNVVVHCITVDPHKPASYWQRSKQILLVFIVISILYFVPLYNIFVRIINWKQREFK